jgi:hypothetical protein
MRADEALLHAIFIIFTLTVLGLIIMFLTLLLKVEPII